jgi:hypothetical protein
MTTKKQGSRKAPRKHQPHWKDNTSSQRTKDRTAQDNRWAYTVSRGRYDTLRKLMTAINNGEIILVMAQPTLRQPDGGNVSAKK